MKIGFDIGGNGVQYMVEGEICSFSTKGKKKNEVLISLAEVINKYNPKYVGISTPCAVNTKTGYLSGLSGIEGWSEFNLYDELGELLTSNPKILAVNDANGALLGEMSINDIKNAVQITIGTGIGGAIVLNGKLITGKAGYSGEFGYGFAGKGDDTYSKTISTDALLARINSNGFEFRGAKEAIKADIKEVNSIIDVWMEDLARFIINLNYFLDPNLIFVAGGITKWDLFESKLSTAIKQIYTRNGYSNKLEIKISSLDNPGIIGALNIEKYV